MSLMGENVLKEACMRVVGSRFLKQLLRSSKGPRKCQLQGQGALMNNSQQILRDSLKVTSQKEKGTSRGAVSDMWPQKPVKERGSDRRVDA